MTKYDFDKVWDRWDTNAIKWDKTKDASTDFYTQCDKEDVVPMWIADMDFATAPSVTAALEERIAHPIFGYCQLPDRYIAAIASWQKQRFDTDNIKRENILYQNSVLGGVASAVVAYTQPGDYILTLESTYTGFQTTVKNLGRYFCYSQLFKDAGGIFRMDFADMEKQIIDNKVSMMIFCSPHNPTGRVWDKPEIQEIVRLCIKHEVVLISDEIWSDFVVEPGKKHIPTQSISDTARQITFAIYAPSKTFNLAGLIGAYSVCYNKKMQEKIEKVAVATHYNNANVLSITACCGAYEGGGEWVDQLLLYIRKNQEYLHNFFTQQCKGVSAFLPQGTYLMWIDIEKTGMKVEEVLDKLKAVGILVNDGRAFRGKSHLRFNLACPHSQVAKACEKMKKVFEQI